MFCINLCHFWCCWLMIFINISFKNKCLNIYTIIWWHKWIPRNISVLPNGGADGSFGPSPVLELISFMVYLFPLYVYFWFIGKILKIFSDSGLDTGVFQRILGLVPGVFACFCCFVCFGVLVDLCIQKILNEVWNTPVYLALLFWSR